MELHFGLNKNILAHYSCYIILFIISCLTQASPDHLVWVQQNVFSAGIQGGVTWNFETASLDDHSVHKQFELIVRLRHIDWIIITPDSKDRDNILPLKKKIRPVLKMILISSLPIFDQNFLLLPIPRYILYS